MYAARRWIELSTFTAAIFLGGCGTSNEGGAEVEVAQQRAALNHEATPIDIGAFGVLTTPTQAIQEKWEEYEALDCPGRIIPGPPHNPGQWTSVPAFVGLGTPVSSVEPTPGAAGFYREYQRGVIVYSQDFGAFLLPVPAFSSWMGADAKSTSWGDNLHAALGVPTQDGLTFESSFLSVNCDKLREALFDFKQPAIFEGGELGAEYDQGSVKQQFVPIYGAIYTAYVAPPGTYDSVPEGLGTLADWREWPQPNGGRFQVFENGVVYAKSETEVAVMPTRLHERYVDAGGIDEFGWPLAEPDRILDAAGNGIGWSQVVENGKLFYPDIHATGLQLLTGSLLNAYELTYGGPAGELGWPTSGVGASPVNAYPFIDFEGGVLVSHPNPNPANAGTVVTPFRKLEVHIDEAQGNDSDCILGICGDLDIFTEVKVRRDGTLIYDQRHPDSGDVGNSTYEDMGIRVDIGRGRSDLDVTVSVKVIDGDNWPNGDDPLGTPSHTYNIDNLWGFFENDLHQQGVGDIWARAHFGMREHDIEFDATDFRANLWWAYRNFTTAELSYDTYSRTFLDVAPDESGWFNPMNWVFYELAYKSLADGGNCVGMTIESTFAQNDRSPYNEPISRFLPTSETDANFRPVPGVPHHDDMMEVINIKMGYQLGLQMVGYVVYMFTTGQMHEPASLYSSVQADLERGDYPVISTFNSYFFGGGHSVRPYRASDSGPSGDRTIWVADPNLPVARNPDDDDSTIRVWTVDEGTYAETDCFKFDSLLTNGNSIYTDAYEGCRRSGGRIFSYPYSIYGQAPYTPYSDLLLLVVGSDGGVAQVSDTNGRKLFKTGLTGVPMRWDDLNDDSSTALSTVAPIPFTLEGGDSGGKVFASRLDEQTLTYETTLAPGIASGTVYSAALGAGKLSSLFDIPGTEGVPELITAKSVNTGQKAITLKLPSASDEKAVTWQVISAIPSRWAKFENLVMVPDQAITMRMEHAGRRVVVDNDGPETTATLTISGDDGEEPVVIGEVLIPSGENAAEFNLPGCDLDLPSAAGLNGWHTAPVTVELTGLDLNGRGIDRVEWSRDTQTWQDYSGPFSYADEGETALHYRAVDTSGKQSPPQHRDIKIDTRAPVVDQGVSGTYTRVDAVSLNFSATDPTPGSGIDTVSATYNGQPVTPGNAIDLFWAALGPHDVAITAKDIAGWESHGSQQLELVATFDSLKETIRELRRRGEITSDLVEWSFTHFVKHADRAHGKAQQGGWFSWLYTVGAKTRLRVLLHRIEHQRGRHISEKAADLLAGDVNYVLAGL